MTAPTQPVTINLADFGGPALEGVKVVARLSQVDYTASGVFVSTEPVTGLTDATGTVVLNLFPNAVSPAGLGTVGTTVMVTASIPRSQPLNVEAAIPDEPCNLVDVLMDDVPVGLTAAQLAVSQAQGYAVQAINANTAAQAVLANADFILVANALDGGSIDTVAVSIASVNVVAANAASVNLVAGSIANVNLTGASIASIDTLAPIAASIVTAAGIAGDISAVADVATEVEFLAQNIDVLESAGLAASTTGVYPNSAASNVPRGLTQASVGAITPGAGGTNGTFALAFTAGTGWLIYPTGTFTVAGGVVTAVNITGPGLCISAAPVAPTRSFAASAGLTGAAVAITLQFLISAGEGYWVTSVDRRTLDRYTNTAGVATRDTSVESIPTIYHDASVDDFPGSDRSLYGPLYTPRVVNLSGSNFATEFPPDHEFTVSAGLANDYSATMDGLPIGVPIIFYAIPVSGLIGVTTLTHNGTKTMTDAGPVKLWEGTSEAATATLVIKNGSATDPLVARVFYAHGAVAAGDDPEETVATVYSFIDAGMPASDEELLRATPLVQTGMFVPEGVTFMGFEATSALVTITQSLLDAGVVVGDFLDLCGFVPTLNGEPGVMCDMEIQITAGGILNTFKINPIANRSGGWHRRIYLDPALFGAGGPITLARTSARNQSNSAFYNETPRYVHWYIFKDRMPRFYASAYPDEGRGIQHVGNMRAVTSSGARVYSTTVAAEYTGYTQALFGVLRRFWMRSAAGGGYLVVRKDPDTGDFIGTPVSVTHPGTVSGSPWSDLTSQIPSTWKKIRPQTGYVIGFAPDPGAGSPGAVEYATSVVGDTALTNGSWKAGTADGTNLTLFAGVGERMPGIYTEAEDRPGAVKRMGPTPLTRTGPADFHLVWGLFMQSVGEGYALRPDNYADFSPVTPAAAQMWSRSQSKFIPLHDPATNSNQSGGSMWPAYAKEFEELMKSRSVLYVPSGCANTKMAPDWWDDATGAKAQWTQALADLTAAKAAAAAVGWPISSAEIQADLGTSDAISGTTKAAFKADVTAGVAQARAVLGPNVPIFWRPVGRGNPGTVGEAAKFAVIREAVYELANEISNFYIASGSAVSNAARGEVGTDYYHETLAAHHETGKQLAAASAALASSRAYPLGYAPA